MKKLIRCATSSSSASTQLGIRGKIYKDNEQVGYYIANFQNGTYSYSIDGFRENFISPEELISYFSDNGYTWKTSTTGATSKRSVNSAINPWDEDYTERISTTLTRTIEIVMQDVEIEVDEDNIEFSKYDWVESLSDKFGYIPSSEDDPEIDELDDIDSVIEKVTKLLLSKVFESVNRYRTYKINKCSIDLAYLVPYVEYEATNRGYYTGQGEVIYDADDIYWSEADSTVECDWSRL